MFSVRSRYQHARRTDSSFPLDLCRGCRAGQLRRAVSREVRSGSSPDCLRSDFYPNQRSPDISMAHVESKESAFLEMPAGEGKDESVAIFIQPSGQHVEAVFRGIVG